MYFKYQGYLHPTTEYQPRRYYLYADLVRATITLPLCQQTPSSQADA